MFRKAIAKTIIQGEAEDVLAPLKDSYPQLNDDAHLWLDTEANREVLEVYEIIE